MPTLSLRILEEGESTRDIYTVRSDGTDLVQVTHSRKTDEFPDWGTHALTT